MATGPEVMNTDASNSLPDPENRGPSREPPTPSIDPADPGQGLVPSGAFTATRCSRDEGSPDGAEPAPELTGAALHALSPAQQRSVRSIHNALRREHTSIVKAMGQVLLHAKKAGEFLDRLTQIAPKGSAARVRDEVCTSLGISERTGFLYLRIFKHWEEIEKATDIAGLAMESLSLRRALSLIPKKTRTTTTAPVLAPVVPPAGNVTTPAANLDLTNPSGSEIVSSGDVLDRVVKFMNGDFAICVTNHRDVIPTKACVSLPAALTIEWAGSVWLDLTSANDPGPWLDKLRNHLANSEMLVDEAVIMLALPNDVLVWECVTELAQVIVLLALDPAPTDLAPHSLWSVLAYVGSRRKSFAMAFSELGTAMVPVRPA